MPSSCWPGHRLRRPSLMSNTLLHLNEHPAIRAAAAGRLRLPVLGIRRVPALLLAGSGSGPDGPTKDCTWGGQELRENDRAGLVVGVGHHDETAFPDPEDHSSSTARPTGMSLSVSACHRWPGCQPGQGHLADRHHLHPDPDARLPDRPGRPASRFNNHRRDQRLDRHAGDVHTPGPKAGPSLPAVAGARCSVNQPQFRDEDST